VVRRRAGRDGGRPGTIGATQGRASGVCTRCGRARRKESPCSPSTTGSIAWGPASCARGGPTRYPCCDSKRGAARCREADFTKSRSSIARPIGATLRRVGFSPFVHPTPFRPGDAIRPGEGSPWNRRAATTVSATNSPARPADYQEWRLGLLRRERVQHGNPQERLNDPDEHVEVQREAAHTT